MTGVALSRTIARCPSRESAESFWTKRCLASSFGVPGLPVRSVSRTRHVPPDESVAPGARVRGGLGGAHAPHRKQVRARPRNVVLPTLVSEASRDASTLRLSPKESWHPSAPPNLRTRSDTCASSSSSSGANPPRARTATPCRRVWASFPATPSLSARPPRQALGFPRRRRRVILAAGKKPAWTPRGRFSGRARWRRGRRLK